MVRIGVELEPRVRLRDEPRERAGTDRVRPARHLPVAPVRGRLAEADESAWVPRLDALVRRRVQLGVQPGADDPPACVELRAEEELQVRLVPHRPEAHERIAGVSAGIPRSEGLGEVGQVGHPRREDVRPLFAVGPFRCAPDRQQHLHAALLRVAHELVDVVELVGGIERVRRIGRARRSDGGPRHDGADHRRVRAAGTVERHVPVAFPAKAWVVVESDPHPLAAWSVSGRDECREECEHDGSCDTTRHDSMVGRRTGVSCRLAPRVRRWSSWRGPSSRRTTTGR